MLQGKVELHRTVPLTQAIGTVCTELRVLKKKTLPRWKEFSQYMTVTAANKLPTVSLIAQRSRIFIEGA